jgi:beta-glucanase (GH16 family)
MRSQLFKPLVLALIFLLVAPPTINNSRVDTFIEVGSRVGQENRYTLIWLEDFSEPVINESVWNFNVGDGCPDLCGWGNGELEYYRRENAFIENSNLVIEARRERFVDPSTGKEYGYTSARLDTIGKLRITPPVRIEIRAKLLRGRGLWPALWLLGEEWSLQNVRAWPSCGEIDIMELLGHQPDLVYGTVHAPYCYGSRGVQSQFRLPAGTDFSQDYHVFGVEVTSDYIVWFVDGQVYHIVTRGEFEGRGCVWVFDKSLHLIVNVAVGGYWPGKPDESTPFPARMYIDWIKVFRVNEPTYSFVANISDSDDELLARTRGFPSATLERIVNGGFEDPIDLTNTPMDNPDDWYFSGRLDVLDEENTRVENGVLRVVLKPPGPGSAGLKLGQLVWVYQNTSYTIRLRAWSSKPSQLALRVSLPVYPPRVYDEAVIQLKTEPGYYDLGFDNPPWGSNIVEVALLYNGTLSDSLTLYIDKVEICRTGGCAPITETTTPASTSPTTQTTLPETTTSPTTSSKTLDSTTLALAAVVAATALMGIWYVLVRKGRSF